MKTTVSLAVLCLGAGLALPAAAQIQQSTPQMGQHMGGQQQPQQMPGQQMGQQQYGQQMPGQPMGQQQMGQQQMPGQQMLTEERIDNFIKQAENVLQQTARTQDPARLQQYMNQYVAPNASITSVTELFVGNRHVATTVANATDESIVDALGYSASALQGRKLVNNYDIEMDIKDIQIMPGQQSARVTLEIEESGNLVGPVANRVAERIGQLRQRLGELRSQMQQDQGQRLSELRGRMQDQSQMGQGQQGQQGMQQGWGQTQDGSRGGMGMGMGSGGAPDQGIRFQSQSDCVVDVMLQQGQMRIGNTFCRGRVRLG